MRNPLTLEAFAEWCEKQPPSASFNYSDPRNCAFCQYLKSLGFERPGVRSTHWRPVAGDYENERALPVGLVHALAAQPWTFGALAARLKGYPTP